MRAKKAWIPGTIPAMFRIRYSVLDIIRCLLYRSSRVRVMHVDRESQSAFNGKFILCYAGASYDTADPDKRLAPERVSIRCLRARDCAYPRRTHTRARGARGSNRTCVRVPRGVSMHKGGTGLSRRLIYRRVRYRAPRATICRCVVLLLIEMWSWTIGMRSFARNRRRRPRG